MLRAAWARSFTCIELRNMLRLAVLALFALPLAACAQRPPSSASAAVPSANTAAAAHPDTTRNPLLFPGADIGERINAALRDCKLQCTVRVPAGNYSFSTTIHLPLMPFGMYALDLDPGAILTYTGSSDAIAAPANGLRGAELVISGGQLLGTATAQAGIHTYPTNKVTIRNMTIRGFSRGDGIDIEGTNTVLITDNDITYNAVGVRLVGTHCPGMRDAQGDLVCGAHLPGNGYAPNAIHVIGNMIVENSQWGVWEDGAPGVTEALDNLYLGNDLEANGHDPLSGAMWLAFSRATQVVANYFEGGPHYLIVGAPHGAPAVGVAVRGNYFTTNAAAPISIDLAHSIDAMIEDNSQYDGFPNSPTPCFVELGQETGTYLGKNHTESQSVACRGGKPAMLPASAFSADATSGDSIGRFVGQLTTTRAAADSLAAPGLTPKGHCAAIPADAHAAALGGLYAEAAAGSVTVHHAPQPGAKLNLFCSLN